MQMLSQKRSQFALEHANKYISSEADNNSKKKEIKSLANGAATMILQNGFGHSLAFWLSKDKPQFNFLLDLIREWLKKNNLLKQNIIDHKAAILSLSSMEQKDYLKCQKETILLLEWVKRYVVAFVGDVE